jgi:uncharacterized protein (DUF58 family)
VTGPAGRRRAGRVVRLATGWALTVAGLVLWITPILPGFFLLLPGIGILCAESRWLRALLRRYRENRLMKRALREAERVGVKINLDAEPPSDDAGAQAPRDRAKGSGG